MWIGVVEPDSTRHHDWQAACGGTISSLGLVIGYAGSY
jgi:hypothetical protein